MLIGLNAVGYNSDKKGHWIDNLSTFWLEWIWLNNMTRSDYKSAREQD